MPALNLELSAEEATRITTPAYNDALDVQATGEFNKERTQLMASTPSQAPLPPLSPLSSPLSNSEPASHPGAEATQLIREYDASSLDNLDATMMAPTPIKNDDRRKAIVTLLLLGLGLVVVAIVVIAGLLVLNFG
jgi:hypothetical protein